MVQGSESFGALLKTEAASELELCRGEAKPHAGKQAGLVVRLFRSTHRRMYKFEVWKRFGIPGTTLLKQGGKAGELPAPTEAESAFTGPRLVIDPGPS